MFRRIVKNALFGVIRHERGQCIDLNCKGVATAGGASGVIDAPPCFLLHLLS